MAVANYHDIYQCFPPAVTAGSDGRPAHSWRILLLPFLEQKELYDQYNFDEPWDGPNNRLLSTQMPRVFSFDGTHRAGESTSTNFVAVTGTETMWPPDKKMSYLDVCDPSSATFMFVEYNGPPIHWMQPVDLQYSTMNFQTGSPDGIDSMYLEPAVAMVDGSVHRLKADISPTEVQHMCTACGNDGGPFDRVTVEMEDARKRSIRSQQYSVPSSNIRRNKNGQPTIHPRIAAPPTVPERARHTAPSQQ